MRLKIKGQELDNDILELSMALGDDGDLWIFSEMNGIIKTEFMISKDGRWAKFGGGHLSNEESL